MKRLLFFTAILIFSLSGSGTNLPKAVNAGNALWSYLNNDDKTFDWKVVNSQKSEGLTYYQIILTSQKWRGINWRHELTLMVPEKVSHNEALLFITGGSLKNEQPTLHKLDDGLIRGISQIALKTQAITSVLWQVPNQPLYGDLTEDALISYTLHNFQQDHDYTWPLLFPMVKSAVKAMNVIGQFSKNELKKKVQYFVVSGASKRGWTTWLTGANDTRVKAIAPMVIDMLNMPVNISYHKKVWGDYSIEIEDYVKLGLAQQMDSPDGNAMVTMIDPYSYRSKLAMPKMIFMGTNDQYWPVDAVKNYIDDIPGNNHICYIPNAGHDMGDKKQAFATLGAFFETTVTDSKYPVCNYSLTENNGGINISVKTTSEQLQGANLWTSNSEDQDFRNDKWSPENLNVKGAAEVKAGLKYPASGYRAFYVELRYKTVSGAEYSDCTRIFVANNNKVLLRDK